MDINLLNEAFQSFTRASKSLESYYAELQERIRYLTEELEKKIRHSGMPFRRFKKAGIFLRQS